MLASFALIPLAAALLGASPAISEPRSISVPLTASAEASELQALGLAGDADGSGMVRLTVDPQSRRICYDFTLTNVATPRMAHIHKGTRADNGPSVVTLFTGPGDMRDCLTWTEKWVNAIAADPSGFYVNLYTTEFPDGALRGQLPG
jgi:hypothetical protein